MITHFFNFITKLKLYLILNLLFSILLVSSPGHALNISQVPLFVSQAVIPQVMLTMSNDHQLYFEAYPDYADLTGNGAAERTYNHAIDYYGYFDSKKCYDYDATQGMFQPKSITADKYCAGNWSGNFLNYISMARIDVIRKILYGGSRSTDTVTTTVLERTYLPNDAHSWVRYYDGFDLPQLTPFSSSSYTTTTSVTSITIPAGSRNDTTDRRTFATGWNNSSQVQIGDQLIIESQALPQSARMLGVVRSFNSGLVEVQITSSDGTGVTRSDWQLTNNSRRGYSFCNTSVAPDGTFSQIVTTPPLIRISQGNYSLWTANERHQCRWQGEVTRSGHSEMQIGGLRFSNGNDVSSTGIFANSDNPPWNVTGIQTLELNALVQVCVAGLVGTEKCKQYPQGNLKPIGLLQQYGEDEILHFGLLTGSYMRNKSGGVLRRSLGNISNEINITTDGTFKSAPSGGGIIRTLNSFRIYGYRHHTGTGNNDATYNAGTSDGGDNCPWGLNTFNDGRCTNWGNPQSEIFLETLRYLAGKQPHGDYVVSGTDRLSGLPALTAWQDPLSNSNWCADLSIVSFNSSASSYDADQLSGVSGLGASSAASLTGIVGQGENIHDGSWFVGQAGSANDQLCTSKTVGSLGDVLGICPEAPRLQGSYHIAGLAHYAYTESIRGDLVDSQGNAAAIQTKTYGVSLAPAVPRLEIPRPGQSTPAVTLLPACRNTTISGNCAIVDFKVIEQDLEAGLGSFLVQWEDSEQGGDYDMDLNGVIRYQITDDKITITTNVFSQSTTNAMGFGYVISGTTLDGFQVHSGINGYNRSSGSDVPGCSHCQYNDPATSYTYTLGPSTAQSLREPLYYAAKWGGYNKSKNFPTDPTSWDSTGDGLPDNYYYAIDPSKLADDLENIFKEVVETTGSAASVVANSVRLDTGTYVYQARFRTSDWSGELISFPVLMDGSTSGMDWEAGNMLPQHTQRNIYTYNPESTPKGVKFQWNNLNVTQQSFLMGDGGTTHGQAVLNYLRGDKSNELPNGIFRARTRLLGDIINSDPVFVGAANFGYNVSTIAEGFTGDELIEGAYNQFLNATKDRTKMIYLGANDGMLHGFRADDGVEMMAYIPNEVFPHLRKLTDPEYEHRYFVDGPPRVGDAFINGEWRTILVGSTGAGGRSVFALDVTDPDNFTAANVLWEFTDPELGYSIGQPTIARLKNGQWVAIFGNGYGSNNHLAKLFIVNLTTGARLGAIDTQTGTEAAPNGLSTPIPVDINNDRITDYAYAGDLLGNLWKFDLTSSNINNPGWGVAYKDGNTLKPLFTARDRNGNVQPITARPVVGSHPNGGKMVYFGTGKFFETGDNVVNNITKHQTFYGIRDTGFIPQTDRSILKKQHILFEGVHYDMPVRVTSNYLVNYTDTSDSTDPIRRGWYLDLIKPTNILQGERVVSPALLRNGRIILTTMIPSEHPCDFGGSSWLMELDALSGGRLDFSFFDFNGDMFFNVEDFVTVTIVNEDDTTEEVAVPVSGVKLDVGIAKTPAVISAGEVEYKYFSGSSGDMQVVLENPGDAATTGRQSWRQLR
ncbi:type IV pilus assembly protein PilY1 [Desulfonatronum thiosulfatophilum]|uniref:Type IV pilus assembly protein PilY1 n=1 Tax=Desulfonatronum thiosulfatophilum TaxID=617002 RepID=A0A1G6A2Q0_9BACT|nr:PilC/PilY family type IV pilus protein [Desulfonatronum thiosulfatophilum]SDB02687.1 type IV pilus assembly protein PilY1 [Desulfonatronum thiosulfatophilum]